MSDTSGAPSLPSTQVSTDQWLQRVSSIQRERATPEVLEELRRRSDAARRASIMHKCAQRMSASRSLTSAAFHSGVSAIAEMTSPQTPIPAADLAVRSRTLDATTAMNMLSSPEFMSPVYRSRAVVDAEEDLAAEEAEEELRSAALRNVIEQQVTSGALDQTSASAAMSGQGNSTVEQSSLAAALKQLEKEPADEAECTSKFELYTTFQKLTETSRDATFELWDKVKGEFASAAATQRQIERQLRSIDSENNMGIQDDPNRWFVHSMCKVAARNQRQIDGVLNDVSRKLELLASQTSCPICFDDFSAVDRPATTLGCAHKTCHECWTHWCAVNGGNAARASCPLCRHDEFLGDLLRAADGAPELS